MKFEEYQDLYMRALQLDSDFKEIEIPVEVSPGESPTEALLRFLEEKGFIEIFDDFFNIIDREAIIKFDNNLMKLLDAICMSNAMAEMDQFEEKGWVYTSVDDEGQIIYILTEEGKKFLG